MAKRKTKKSRSHSASPKHILPAGFWSQVIAVLLIALGLLLFVTWFNASGPVLENLNGTILRVVGYGVFALPFLLIYLGIEIFRSENNRLSIVTYLATFILISLIGAFFGLAIGKNVDISTGGVLGDQLNQMILALVVPNVAIFIELILIMIVSLFLFKVSPSKIISSLAEVTRSSKEGSIIRKARGFADDKKISPEFNLVEGVPTENSFKKDNKSIEAKRRSGAFGGNASKPVEEAKTALISVQDPNWKMPSVNLLGNKQTPADVGDVKQNAKIIKDTLHEFGIEVEMTGANIGPKVTQYTLMPASGVKLTKIATLENNIALNLAAQSLRIEAPIPGKKAVGIEVPNLRASDVRLRGVIESSAWTNSRDKLAFVTGRDVAGEPVVTDLSDMPHLLIAGQTGSGKSVMINTLLVSLLYRNSPSDMKLILVDPKQVELAPYEDIPHLLTPIITDPAKTISALKWAVNEMERRYTLLKGHNKKNISDYNDYIKRNNKTVQIEGKDGIIEEHRDGAMPYIVIVIDEMSDLMQTAGRDVEAFIVRLAQKSRAVGIHLVLATQRPSVNVVTGLIKANVPARIAFTVASQVDSKTIIDKAGAEKLLGKGDMLLVTATMNKPRRIQGAWVTDEEVIKVTEYLKEQMEPQYNDEITTQEVHLNIRNGGVVSGELDDDEDSFNRAVQVVIESGKASTTLLQRRLKIGYGKAANLMEMLEERGVVSEQDGSRPRQILISSIDDLE